MVSCNIAYEVKQIFIQRLREQTQHTSFVRMVEETTRILDVPSTHHRKIHVCRVFFVRNSVNKVPTESFVGKNMGAQ